MNARLRWVLLGMAGFCAVGAMVILRGPKSASADPTSTLRPYERLLTRAEVSVAGTLRRFTNNHPEFGLSASDGAGGYGEIVADNLDSEWKPVFRSSGRRVASPWLDRAGHWLTPREYIGAASGDASGAYAGSAGGAASGGSSFAQLFRTVAGVNMATLTPITLRREGTTYTWEGPIDLSPAPGAKSTLELTTMFVHAAEAGWYYEVETDADVWVFIDEKLVIDGGAGAQSSVGASSSGDTVPLITVSDTIELNNNCVLSTGTGAPVLVQTNSTRARAVVLGQGCRIEGDVLVGVGGNADQVVYRGESIITGRVEPMPVDAPVPDVVFPAVGPVTGDVTINEVVDVAANMHVGNLTIFSGGHLRIHGDVTIVCDDAVRLSSDAHLDVLPGSSLHLYAQNEIFISATSTVNNLTRDPRLAVLATRTTGRVTVNSRSGIYADVIAPRGTLLVNNDSIFAGSFTGHAVQLNNGAGFFAASEVATSTASTPAVYRIDLDRLAWLSNGQTHYVRFFVADRDGVPSRFRVRSNISALNVAAYPYVGGSD